MSMIAYPSDFSERVIRKFFPTNDTPPGPAFGWESTHYLRCPPNELSVWSGFNGHGKSLLLGQVMLNMAVQGEHVMIASMELPGHDTMSRIARQAFGPAKPTKKDVGLCLQFLDRSISIYNRVGTADNENMFNSFKESQDKHGTTQFVIDSLTKCNMGEDDYRKQKEFAERCHDFSMVNNCHVHLVAHAKKPREWTDNKGNLLGGEKIPPSKYDILGASGISNIANNVYVVWRNKAKEWATHENEGIVPEDAIEAPDAKLICEKSREYGSDAEKTYRFYFDKRSMQYLVELGEEPRKYFKVAGAPY